MKKEMKNKMQEITETVNREQILSENSRFVEREAYKTLRTNLRFSLHGDGCKKICITSSASGEGKSITILNLAISFAEAGQKVLLIDADLRRPSLARLLDAQASVGLANVLADLAPAGQAIHKGVYPNLDVMFSGDIPPNPLELLSSENMKKLISSLEKEYEYILVDAPPAGVVSDACVLATLLDGALFLVREGKSYKDNVKQAVESLQLVGVKILGFVLNGVALDASKRYKTYE